MARIHHMTPRSNAFALHSADIHPRALSRYARGLALFQQGLDRYDEVRQQQKDEIGLGRYDRARGFLAAARAGFVAGGTLTFQYLLPDAAKPLRGAIEAAFGAFHVYHDPAAWTRWRERPLASHCGRPAREARRAVASEFAVPNITREIRSWSPSVAAAGLRLYEELIDVGGHFNYPAFHFVESPDEAEVVNALKRLNRTGAVCLRMLELLYGGIWDDRRLTDQIRTFTGSL
jgi:hypothetical protein